MASGMVNESAPVSKPRAVVLLSGGLDSTVALKIALQQGYDVSLIGFEYGQKHATRELQAASKIADYYSCPLLTVALPKALFEGAGSALIDDSVPIPSSERPGPSSTVVPYRNGTMLSLAATHAEAIGAVSIWAGMHADDGRGFTFPDCTPGFIGAMAAAISIATMMRVTLVTPFVHLSKAHIVGWGAIENVPFELTYSCYNGGELHCGLCITCKGRRLAFDQAKVADPTQYQASEPTIRAGVGA